MNLGGGGQHNAASPECKNRLDTITHGAVKLSRCTLCTKTSKERLVKKQARGSNTLKSALKETWGRFFNSQLRRGKGEACHCEEQTKSATSQSQNVQNSTIMRLPRHSVKGQTAFTNTVPRNDEHVNHLLTYLPTNLLTSKTRKTKVAFTLAEVLITLAIIGVVAAMTMPSLVAKYQEKQTVVQLKKVHNTLSNAFKMAVLENGEISEWDLLTSLSVGEADDESITNSEKSKDKILQYIKPYIKAETVCNYGDEVCIEKNQYTRYSLDGTEFGYFAPFLKMPDGTNINGCWVVSPECSYMENICGQIFVDLNGSKVPNATGKDVFIFYFTKDGSLLPQGFQGDTDNPMSTRCNLDVTHILNGYGCAAWVIYNENMDYLHCKGINWDNPDKCK